MRAMNDDDAVGGELGVGHTDAGDGCLWGRGRGGGCVVGKWWLHGREVVAVWVFFKKIC